ncbi:MAG TPA: hypothetical protein VF736_19655 [Pyrinomonadaceae bacterium]|jgi:hypothetical protein
MSESFFNRRRSLSAAGFVLLLALAPAPVFATQKAGPEARPAPQPGARPADGAQKKPEVKPWSLKMSGDAPHTFTAKAKDAPVSEIAAEMSRLVKVPITLSPLASKQKVTLDFGGLPLEAALRMLAPQTYVDYVAGEGAGEPRLLAVYLQGLNEPPPPSTVAVRGNSQAILIEGDTEEGTEAQAEREKKEEEELRVTWANNQLSVRAKKQPLSVVLYKIASEVGVPFELRYESREMVDVEFENYSLEQAFRSLSPGVRYFYRVDLQTFQVQPLRLALLAPASAKS